MPLSCHICGARLASHPLRSCEPDLEAAPSASSNELAVRRAKTRALYERGYAVAWIARTLGVSQRTVVRDLDRAKHLQETKRVRAANGGAYPTHRLTGLDRARRQAAAVRLIDEGLSVRAVAVQLGWNQSTIRADLRAAGREPSGRVVSRNGKLVPARRSTPAEIEERRAYARALRARGWSVAKVAAELGLSYHIAQQDTAGTHGPPLIVSVDQ